MPWAARIADVGRQERRATTKRAPLKEGLMSAVPTWDQFMAPPLRFLSDGAVHRSRDIREAAAAELQASDEARQELIPSGQRRWGKSSQLGTVIPGPLRRSRSADARKLSDH
jgi:outer membrane protein TolC